MLLSLRTFFPSRAIGACFLSLAAGATCGCRESNAAPKAPNIAASPRLEAYQERLLDLAFDAATALPPMPHIKNRSRAQGSVVEACLELDQPERAQRYLEKIDNWRRGLAHAELAFHWARRGREDLSREHAAQADVFVKDIERRVQEEQEGVIESAQDWQKDRIRALIARTYRLIGSAEDAAPFEVDVVDSEAGELLEERMDRVRAADVEAELGLLDQLAGTGNLDAAGNALSAYVRLFDRFYEDADLRSSIEAAMRASWTKLPMKLRTDATTGLVEAALAHDDRPAALRLVQEARGGLDAVAMPLDLFVPPLARLAQLRHRAGDTAGARAELDGARARYAAEGASIVDIYRAGILRPLAETYLVLGDRAVALELYRQAIEAGTKNPNSRPRAIDLCDTCTSMALHSFEPDPELWRRIDEVFASLGDPW